MTVTSIPLHESSPLPEVLDMLVAARARTLALVPDLRPGPVPDPQPGAVQPPDTVNPILWELGHLGWFEEFWCLRSGSHEAASLITEADTLYDSARVAQQGRALLAMPGTAETLRYLEQVRARVNAGLAQLPQGAYFGELCALHEAMHAEALTYTRQTLAYPALAYATMADAGNPWPGDAKIAGGRFLLGAEPGSGFVFDNEKYAHEVEVRDFCMSKAPVSNAQFAEFVEAGGYDRKACWSAAGWRWRETVAARAPRYWQRHGGEWHQRYYHRLRPLQPHHPVIHVNWYEAEAWCRWAGRRLPTETEWEYAASTVPGYPGLKRRYPWGDQSPGADQANLNGAAADTAAVDACAAGDSAWGLRQLVGNVWEWTADWFQPYPGYHRDPYAEYSEPWFGSHKVLRGGSHATWDRLIRNTWRNFHTPERNDVFAGFRSCAL